MQFGRIFKIGIFCLSFAALAGCHTVKNKGAGAAGTESVGLGDESGFGDGIDRAHRLQAPYNQTYLFGFDRYDVDADDVASINVQANYLVQHPSAKVRLEGNTDERGSREYNITLGWKRARAVSEILLEQGVSSSQIAMVSFGKEKPIAFGHDEEAYAKNRRVDLKYESK